MDGPTTGFTVFGCVLTAAIIGMVGHARLPGGELSAAAFDVVKRGVSMVTVMAALMLALMTVSLKSSYDLADREVKRLSAQVVELDRTLRRGGEGTEPARELLFRYATRVMKDTWPETSLPRPESASPGVLLSRLEDELATLSQNPADQQISTEARRILQDVVETRWALDERAGGSVSPWLFAVMVFWLMVTFASFGLAAPRHPVVICTIVLCAVALGGAMFLIQEFDYPFTGVITVSAEPMQNALFAITE